MFSFVTNLKVSVVQFCDKPQGFRVHFCDKSEGFSVHFYDKPERFQCSVL